MKSTAPALAGAGLQLRGTPAHDTVVLTDGLPLLGAQPEAFELLQTPPLDLERVEVIKGAASALYGGSALGGVLNLVSRAPTSDPSVLANVTSREGADLEGFFSATGDSRWSATLMSGAHYQSRRDVNGDGWADIAGYRRFMVRPRIWWNDGAGDSTFLTAGVVDEDRTGGTLPGATIPGGASFPQELLTRRFDAGVVSHWSLPDERAFTVRASVTSNREDLTFGSDRTPSTRTTVFTEATWTGRLHGHSWVLAIRARTADLFQAAAPATNTVVSLPWRRVTLHHLIAGRFHVFLGQVRVIGAAPAACSFSSESACQLRLCCARSSLLTQLSAPAEWCSVAILLWSAGCLLRQGDGCGA